jgi:hypothetical protein
MPRMGKVSEEWLLESAVELNREPREPRENGELERDYRRRDSYTVGSRRLVFRKLFCVRVFRVFRGFPCFFQIVDPCNPWSSVTACMALASRPSIFLRPRC